MLPRPDSGSCATDRTDRPSSAPPSFAYVLTNETVSDYNGIRTSYYMRSIQRYFIWQIENASNLCKVLCWDWTTKSACP